MIAWWWYFLSSHLQGNPSYRMIVWEGIFLLGVVFAGGLALILLSYRDYQRHERLRVFFSTFSHDLKTSLSILRLKTDLLLEQIAEESSDLDPSLIETLTNDISRIDLQLENSLWLSRGEPQLQIRTVRISKSVADLRSEFPMLNVSIHRDCEVLADPRALHVILRNLFSNSVLHGQAKAVRLDVQSLPQQKVRIDYSDDGKGLSAQQVANLNSTQLILDPHHQKQNSSKGSGIGLHLIRRILKWMTGEITILSSPQGFHARIVLPTSPQREVTL